MTNEDFTRHLLAAFEGVPDDATVGTLKQHLKASIVEYALQREPGGSIALGKSTSDIGTIRIGNTAATVIKFK